ncbi:hypothetical protein EJ05DRAFT_26054 [Pseudovirgaria hyperparasitica]|uniref:Uncharacterized protein n=1 Tax=Pseudovirgaria hyperparasitica TaxID=470096 RepID=A0A6A6WLM5_9PEZI|nr:uncharacterized protein EJ05DRAFT_26054 [Pseudovirgaria hyperparasitica]KAF2763107.1 hypothetical protein EJ05DRAFT_26054 [Pseudovirgaria hyperparasitica]
MSHLFTSPTSGFGHTLSFRASLYHKPSNDRKQDTAEDDDTDDLDESRLDDDKDEHEDQQHRNTHTQRQSVSAPSSKKVLSTLEEEQYRTAGLHTNDEIPPAPFPHRPVRKTAPRITDPYLQKQLAGLNPPIFVPGRASIADYARHNGEKLSTNLKSRHIGVLNAALHKCLSEGDYSRASRIWALLLRSTVNSRPFDIRRDENWRIGAEILLQLHPYIDPFDEKYSHHQNAGEDDEEDEDNGKPLFSEEGYRQARQYYERLIIQYPIAKVSYDINARRVNALTFYPTMFSLWITQIVDNSKRMRYEFLRSTSISNESTPIEHSDSEISSSDSHSREMKREEKKKREFQRIKDSELADVRKLAERLDQLVFSPPTDRDVTLLYIRGMVHVWMGDLLLIEEPDSDAEAAMHSNHLQSVKLRKDEIADAVARFREVIKLGGMRYPQLEILEAEIEERDVDESI